MDPLNLNILREAIAGRYAAIRRVTRLDALGRKVFPPTYEGGEYATEKRRDGGKDVETVLLDSVQSQSNRMELALLRAYDAGKIAMPMTQVDFGANTDEPILKEVGRITALEASHRICDAIFRDSELDAMPFRKSARGSSLDSAKASNATPLLELCPTALLFGFWDSTGPRGGLGAKLQRALVSEIVAYNVTSENKRTSSRIDQLQIENNVEIYATADGDWTKDKEQALKDKKNEPKRLRPSEVNHGNITPSFRDKEGKLNHGGVTLEYAEQQTVLSLAALRKLRFPINGTSNPEADLAGRTLIAALGMAAICFLDEDGFDLRSRCLLDGTPGGFEFVGRGQTMQFNADPETAALLVAQAAERVVGAGLPWPTKPLTLTPSRKLAELVVASRTRSMQADSEPES